MKKKLIIFLLLCSVLLLCGCMPLSQAAEKVDFEMTFLNTGKSDCILIESEGLVILNDTAEEDDFELINSTLQSDNISKIDYLVLSHFDKDHIGCAAAIIENYTVECVILPSYTEESEYYYNLMENIERYNLKTISTDYEISVGKLHVVFNFPAEESYNDDNNYSIITDVKYGSTSYLLLGDALQERMQEYVGKKAVSAGEYNLVKMPHHGDCFKVLKYFIENASPFTAVITDDMSESRTEDELLECLGENDCTTLFSNNGNILVTSDGESIEIVQN